MTQAPTVEHCERILSERFSKLADGPANRCRASLRRYRKALPHREYQALTAWLTTFYPFQLSWLLEPARHAIKNKARQIGLSHTSAACAVLWGVFHGELTTIISKSDDASKETFLKSKQHRQLLVKLGSELARPTRDTLSDLAFASGGRIKCRPSTGAQGDTGNVIIDEFAYHEHPEETLDRAAAAATHGSLRLRIQSTPNGAVGPFARLAKQARPVADATEDDYARHRWVRHETTIHEAIAQGLPVDLDACWAKCGGDARLFDQRYNCKFLDGAEQYIPTQAVNEAATDDLYVFRPEYFAGLDIGRTNDLTALVVVAFDGMRAAVQAIRTHKRTDHAGLQQLVDDAFRRYPIKRLAVDETGLGAFPVDDMRRRHGRRKVEGVGFTLQSKEDLATTMFDAFAGWSGEGDLERRGWLDIPATDKALEWGEPGAAGALRQDVCSIRRVVTSAGNVRYDADRNEDGHADRAWALALALHAISNRPARKIVSGPTGGDEYPIPR